MKITEQFEKYSIACSQAQSNYAVKYFVDGAQPTPERRFRQSVIEMDVAISSFEDIIYEMDKLKIELEDMEDRCKDLSLSTKDKAILLLDIDRNKRSTKRYNRGVIGKQRELDQHVLNLRESEKALGITKDTTESEIYQIMQNAESEYYLLKLAQDAATHIISRNGGAPVGVLNSIQQMPQEDLEKFQMLVHGMIHCVGNDIYNEATHGIGGVDALSAIGKELANRKPPESIE